MTHATPALVTPLSDKGPVIDAIKNKVPDNWFPKPSEGFLTLPAAAGGRRVIKGSKGKAACFLRSDWVLFEDVQGL